MASELRVDTLKDASGNNSIGLSYVAEGSAKSWTNFDGEGTVAIRESFNTSSITDDGTGDYAFNFTNSFADTNYLPVNRTHGFGDTPSTYQGNMTTSSRGIDYYNQNTVKTDRNSAGGVHYGDLA